jgi:hypothetical protein
VAWLVLAVAFGVYPQVYIYTLDFATDMVKAVIANNFNVTFYVYTRFYLFPKDSLALLEHVRTTEIISSNRVHYKLYVGGVFLFLFNLASLGEFIVKTIKYNKNAFFSS